MLNGRDNALNQLGRFIHDWSDGEEKGDEWGTRQKGGRDPFAQYRGELEALVGLETEEAGLFLLTQEAEAVDYTRSAEATQLRLKEAGQRAQQAMAQSLADTMVRKMEEVEKKELDRAAAELVRSELGLTRHKGEFGDCTTCNGEGDIVAPCGMCGRGL